MLRGTHVFLGAALLLLFGSICIYAATWSPTYQNCETNNADNIGQSKQTDFNNRAAVFVICEIDIANRDGSAITAFATIALVISTIGLWLVTGTAANSAKAAAEALPILERAYLFFDKVTDIGFEFVPVVISTDFYGDSTYGPDICVPKGAGLAFNVVNHGKTPAVITEVMGKSAFLPKFGTDMPPPIDVSTECGDRVPPHVSVGTTLGLHCSPNFATPLMFDAKAGEQRLFVLGYVRYIDIFRKRHRIGFCLQYVPSVPTFGLIGEGEYNYTVDED